MCLLYLGVRPRRCFSKNNSVPRATIVGDRCCNLTVKYGYCSYWCWEQGQWGEKKKNGSYKKGRAGNEGKGYFSVTKARLCVRRHRTSLSFTHCLIVDHSQSCPEPHFFRLDQITSIQQIQNLLTRKLRCVHRYETKATVTDSSVSLIPRSTGSLAKLWSGGDFWLRLSLPVEEPLAVTLEKSPEQNVSNRSWETVECFINQYTVRQISEAAPSHSRHRYSLRA